MIRKRGLVFFVAMMVSTFVLAQQSIPITLKTTSGTNNLSVVANGDGSYSINTTGADPYLSANDLTTFYDYNAVYYISFDYIATTGINDLTIYYGTPSADKKVSGGALEPTSVYKTAIVNLKRTATWNTNFTKFRFDFGTESGKSIQVKNITLRNPTPAEFASDPIIKDNAGTAFLNTYLSTNFPNKINSVQVNADKVNLDLNLPANTGNLYLCELKMFNPVFKPENIDFSVALANTASIKTSLDRYVTVRDTTYDRIYSRWIIAEQNGTSWTYKSNAHFADDVFDAAKTYFPEIKPSSKKGIAAYAGASVTDDVNDLGSKSVTVNLLMSNNFLSLTPTTTSYVYNGKTYYFNPTFVSGLDATFKSCSDNDILASIILLLPKDAPGALKSILTHPDADPSAFYSMANLTTLTGLTYYSAMVAFLADRYNRPDNLYGKITNWIIHNEVDAASTWTSAGEKSVQTYTELYDRSMRTVYYTIRQFNPAAKVFFSATHNWTTPIDYSTKDMLGLMNSFVAKEGDYEWGLAHHPYPQVGSAPWTDTQVSNDINSTPLITPKNIELLDTYMRLKTSLYKGLKVRSLMFTEQGVNVGSGTDATTLSNQAAGVAYFWKKFSRLPSLEAVQYHRRVDNSTIFPVNFGLWTSNAASTAPEKQDFKKPSWNVWQAAGTGTETSAFAFALPIIGVSNWEQTFNPLVGEVNLCKVDFNLTSQGAAKNNLNISFNGERHTTQTAGAATFYNVASLTNARTYQIKEGNQTIWPSVATTISADQTLNVNLDPIASFTATRLSATSVKLDWQDITNFESGYVLESKAAGQNDFTKVADISANSTTYLNTSLTAALNYQYRLYAINDTVKTLYSKVVDADGNLAPNQYTAGNLVVLRVGDGTSTLAASTGKVSLLEYSPTGVLVNTTDVPNATAGNRLTLSGNSNQEGVLSLSPNGSFLTFAGYDAATGATDHIGAGTQTRTVALVKNDRSVDLSTRFAKTDMPTTVRSSTTIDGTNFWAVGAAGGVRYLPFGNSVATSTTQLNSTIVNIRMVSTSNGQLYIGGNQTGVTGIAALGAGLPTSAGQTIANLTSNTPIPVAAAFFNLEQTNTGAANDVLYIADNSANTIRKYALVSGVWTENTPAITTSGIYGLTGSVIAGKVVLYATVGANAGNNAIQTLTDANGYNAAISGTLTDLTVPVAAGTNYVFRGISFTPGSSPVTTLPVTLQNFNGKKVQDGVQLNWNTLSENNNERFDVLRSDDATNFQIITSVKGNGTSTKVNSYAYLDSKPLSGINYYQLNQIDFDGKAALSKTVAVNFDVEKDGIVIYSDATNLNFNVKSLKNGEAKVVVYTVNGVEILAKSYYIQSGLSSKSIDISNLKKGVYVVKISLNDMVSTQKFVR